MVIWVKYFQTEKIKQIQVRPTEYVVKYKVRKMTKNVLKRHCYCPVLLMWTTKTAVCLKTKAISHNLYWF